MLKTKYDAETREGENAVIVTHNAVVGMSMNGVVRFVNSDPVRRFKIGQPQSYAQHPVSVRVSFVDPGKRSWRGFTVIPGDLSYVTIENGSGDILYDSRREVPCDMGEFEVKKKKWVQQWRDNGCEVITE